MRPNDPLAELLPLAQLQLLGRAIGSTLIEIKRRLPETLERHVGRGCPRTEHFARASGTTELSFSGGLVHTLSGWSSELSVIVDPDPAWEDPDCPPIRLSQTTAAPAWLRACLGRRVSDVRVYVFLEEDVDSDEARQCAVSYLLESGEELVYCTYLHGRLDGDELVQGRELDRSLVARAVSVADAGFPR